MFFRILVPAAFALTIAACGGGGGGSSPMPNPNPNPTGTTPPDANIPAIAVVAGSNAFVAQNPSNHTLYYLTSDTATGSACTGGCLGVWPAYMAAAGATNFGNMTVITRSDGTGQQWAYQGHPLYLFSGDSGPLQSGGEGIPAPPGVWHVSRPASSGGGGGGGGGGY